ncbi:MAG TPA: HAD family hydrolase [Candidatus Acidoferrales bacterium]|nr:HAD family hydrolase [Candidatus Acidoferrales bacterium]
MTKKTLVPRAVLLDWDGTLLNSYASDTRAYLSMFRALKIEFSVAEIERHYSPNWHLIYEAAKIPKKHWVRADRLWRRAYASETPKLLPGARSVLRQLRARYRLGIVTGGSGLRVRKQIRLFEFHRHFSVCVYSEDTAKKKPHPAPLELALKRIGMSAEECVYVGDAPEDIEMARRAGAHAVGVLGPFPTADRIRAAKPDVLLSSIRELPQYLRILAQNNGTE